MSLWSDWAIAWSVRSSALVGASPDALLSTTCLFQRFSRLRTTLIPSTLGGSRHFEPGFRRMGVRAPLDASTLGHHVLGVFESGSEEEVVDVYASTDVARMTYPDANGDFSDLEHPGDAMGTLSLVSETDRPVATGKQGASEDETVTPALGAGQQFGQPIGFHDITSVPGGEL